MSTVISRLKAIKSTPPNGLAIFCGMVATKGGDYSDGDEQGKTKMKKVTVVLEPLHPIKHNLYHCDSRFHAEQLIQQLEEQEHSDCYGFIVVDGSGALFGHLKGSNARVLNSFTVTLPKKHSKGGQSSERFARLRTEARQAYMKQVAEKALKYFIDPQSTLPSVTGIIIAGSANIKDDIVNGQYLDERLARIVKRVVVVAYGGQQGFHQSINEVKDFLSSVKFVREREIIEDFMQLVAQASNKAVYGIEHTMHALSLGVLSRLIVCEDMNMLRVTLHDPQTDITTTRYLTPQQLEQEQIDIPEIQVVDSVHLLQWIVEQHDDGKLHNMELELVSDKTSEGRQLAMGFGGIAGVLRYAQEFDTTFDACQNYEQDDLSDFM
jgi:peptide chain release factor subunit 1